MKIKLIDFGGRPPIRAHHNDAGADVFACIPDEYDNKILIPPHSIKKVPLGFGLELPDGLVAFVVPRSGMSAIKGITAELVPIDSGYRGEIHAILHNTTNEFYSVEDEHKVAQLVIMPAILAQFTYELQEERGTKAFGSTGY